MVSWSCLGRTVGINILRNQNKSPILTKYVNFSLSKTLKSHDDHRTFTVTPSRWQWHKFKDMFHYYVMVGLIPISLIIMFTNIFIGPAQLQEIPDGYVPKHWEYHQHPITRFIARYIHCNPQQDYEKFMHFLDEESERIQLRELEKRIRARMEEREDYQAYYYRPAIGKYLRVYKKIGEDMQDRLGDDSD